MGFRSTWVSEDNGIKWPEWFLEKYKEAGINFKGCLSSMREQAIYLEPIQDLHNDIRKVLVELVYESPFYLVYLHECHGVTRVCITREDILVEELTGLKLFVDHEDHGYGCQKPCNPEKKDKL
jgi:hypothetical protein